jgi:hypothetical protein
VFPREVYQQAKGGKMKAIWSDPKQHLTSLQRAWETALERAGWILAGRPESMETSRLYSAGSTTFATLLSRG